MLVFNGLVKLVSTESWMPGYSSFKGFFNIVFEFLLLDVDDPFNLLGKNVKTDFNRDFYRDYIS